MVIPLGSARLCINCECVYYVARPDDESPCCGSSAWVYLESWVKPLDRAKGVAGDPA